MPATSHRCPVCQTGSQGAAAHTPNTTWRVWRQGWRSIVPTVHKAQPSGRHAVRLHPIAAVRRMQWPAQRPHHIHLAAQHAQQQAPLQTMAVICPHVAHVRATHPIPHGAKEKGSQGSHVGAAGRRQLIRCGGSCQVAAKGPGPKSHHCTYRRRRHTHTRNTPQSVPIGNRHMTAAAPAGVSTPAGWLDLQGCSRKKVVTGPHSGCRPHTLLVCLCGAGAPSKLMTLHLLTRV